MASTLSCCNTCGTVEVTQIPGLEGAAGVDGVDGVNAYTLTTADFEIPVIGNNVTVQVESSVWMVIGQVLIVGSGYANAAAGGPAHFTVISIPTATSVELQALGSIGDATNPDDILTQASVSPSAA